MYAVGMTTVEALPPERPIHGQMVLLPTPPPGGFIAADLPRLIEAVDARFELLDGEVLMMAPATHWHDEVIDILKHALRRIAPRSLVVATEKGIDLGRTVPEPDVLLVSRAVVTSGSLVFQPADVHLAIEVVSPGTTTKDRTLRPAQYASAGIKCFWRVENEDDAMVVYTFELLPEGGYAPTGVFRGRVKVDRPVPIDIELPEVTWLSGAAEHKRLSSPWFVSHRGARVASAVATLSSMSRSSIGRPLSRARKYSGAMRVSIARSTRSWLTFLSGEASRNRDATASKRVRQKAAANSWSSGSSVRATARAARSRTVSGAARRPAISAANVCRSVGGWPVLGTRTAPWASSMTASAARRARVGHRR
jgi:Uma2 family endonuclease